MPVLSFEKCVYHMCGIASLSDIHFVQFLYVFLHEKDSSLFYQAVRQENHMYLNLHR